MLEIGGRPFLEYLVVQLRNAGVGRIVLATGYGADAVEAYFGDGRRHGVAIEHSREAEPLGTGGALRLAVRRLPDQPVLALNGDSVLAVNPTVLLAVLSAWPGTAAVLALRSVPDAARYGTVELGPDGRVTAFVEKSAAASGWPGLVNAGIYAIAPGTLDALPANAPSSFERDLLPSLAAAGRLRGWTADAYFVDIGIPETLLALRADPTPLLDVMGGR